MQTLQRYGVLILFVLLFVVGLFIRYGMGEESALWSIWSAIDVSFAVVLGILAYIAYSNIVRAEDQVRLVFNVANEKEVDTGLCLLRKNCTRSEVIGVISMMQKKSPTLQYDASHLHDLLEEINSVQVGSSRKLRIIISQEEFEQFNTF
jgi:hypothetical protein